MMKDSMGIRPGSTPVIEGAPIDGQFILRLTTIVFLEHPLSKFFDVPFVTVLHGTRLASLTGIAGAIELLGGLMVLLGFKTRAAAFILSGEMAVAYFLAHAPGGFFPVLNGGEAACLYSLVFLALVFLGGGRLSLDRVLRRRSIGSDI